MKRLKQALLFIFLFLGEFSQAASFEELSYKLINGDCPKDPAALNLEKKHESTCPVGSEPYRAVANVSETVVQSNENSYFASLAKERKEILDCSGKQLSSLTENNDQAKAKLETFSNLYVEKLTALAKAKKRMNELSGAVATSDKARQQYKEAKAAANATLQELKFTELKSVRLMVNQIVSQEDMFNGNGPEEYYKKEMKTLVKTALQKAASDLKSDQEILSRGIQSQGQSFDQRMRESLAQDTEIIEIYRAKNKAHENIFKPVACVVDAKYGKGAQYRDNAILALTVLGTAGTMAPAVASAGLASSITGAVAVGSIPLKAGRIFRVLAAAGQSASTISEIEKACVGNTPTLTASAGKAGQICEPDALKSMESDSCFLAGALNALNVPLSGASKLANLANKSRKAVAEARGSADAAKDLSKTDRLLAKHGLSREDLAAEKAAARSGRSHPVERSLVHQNAMLTDEQRVKKIKEDFPNLSSDQAQCVVEKVHSIGSNNSSVYHYSAQDIAQKARVARRTCKIGVPDIDALIRLGYAGKVPTGELADGAKELSDFEKLMGMTRPAQEAAPAAKEEIKLSFKEIDEALSKERDPLKRARLRQQLMEAHQDEVARTLEENPKFFDSLLKKDVTLHSESSLQRKTLTLSPEKAEQLASKGASPLETMSLEIKPGDTGGFRSAAHGEGFGEILGVDPHNPKNFMVRGPKGDFSIAQTELALTDHEKAQVAADLVQKNAGQDFNQLLKGGTPLSAQQLGEKIGQDLAKQVGTNPQAVKVEALEEQMVRLESKYKNDPAKLMLESNYSDLKKQHDQLSNLSYDQKMVLKAVAEINPNDLSTAKQAQKVLDEAEKIKLEHAGQKLNLQDQELLRSDLSSLRKAVEAAPQKANHRDAEELLKMNGTSQFGRVNNLPARQALVDSVGDRNFSLSVDQYRSMENMFKEDPRHLSAESLTWLQRSGRPLESRIGQSASKDPKAQEVQRRLQLYLQINDRR